MRKLLTVLVLGVAIFAGLAFNYKPKVQPVPIAPESLEVVRGDPFYESSGELGAGSLPRRPSEYKTTLAQSLAEGHVGTTLKVNSITTKDGNTLDSTILGDTIVLHIAPGRTNAEIVKCTSLTTATKTFTGCTFGMKFTGENSSSASNIKAHAPGETVIISNDDVFLSTQYATLDGLATVTGEWVMATTTTSTFLTIGGSDSTYNRRILAVVNGQHKGFLEYNATSSKWFISNNFADTIDIAAGGSGVTGGKGVVLSGSAIDVATTTGASGLFFTDAGAPRTLAINTRAGEGLFIDTDDHLKVASSSAFVWTGAHRHTGSFIVNNATSTITAFKSDTATATTMVIGSTQPTSAHTTNGLWVNAATSTLSVSSPQFCASSASDQCTTVFNRVASGSTTRTAAAGSGTVTVTGLGFTPVRVEVWGVEGAAAGGSFGQSDGTNNISINGAGTSGAFNFGVGQAVDTTATAGDSNYWTATVGNFAQGSFDVVYTKGGTPATITVYYTAYK